MKFNRMNLIKSIDENILIIRADARKKYDDAFTEYYDAEREWLASEHPAYFIEAAKELIRHADAEVVTHDTLAPLSNTYGSPAREHVFSRREPKYVEPDVDELQNLRNFLADVTDEEVSSSGLRDVGFRNLARIMHLS